MPNPTETTTDPAPMRFHVTLTCPTPLAFPELEVEAATKDEAWQKFCAANGISDSEHLRKIVPL
jgi:hypothetical protein